MPRQRRTRAWVNKHGNRWRVRIRFADATAKPTLLSFATEPEARAFAAAELTRLGEYVPGGLEVGGFYAVQLMPRDAPGIIKLGWSSDPEKRLKNYKTANPTARIIGRWECEAYREKEAIHHATVNCGAESLGGEVLRVESISELMFVVSSFFHFGGRLSKTAQKRIEAARELAKTAPHAGIAERIRERERARQDKR